ncbi:hypothetical protein RHGRI_000718 [Rhododendron griersonianum]|uniref:Uncharacterized protein n=1 Tax=Rhododendron griersonianum TaxID=479676 RepID=A0AAV6LIP1_9ERIC|nr:hypothetical protein RHGRI_000718 [Rhododendron griersonianum]
MECVDFIRDAIEVWDINSIGKKWIKSSSQGLRTCKEVTDEEGDYDFYAFLLKDDIVWDISSIGKEWIKSSSQGLWTSKEVTDREGDYDFYAFLLKDDIDEIRGAQKLEPIGYIMWDDDDHAFYAIHGLLSISMSRVFSMSKEIYCLMKLATILSRTEESLLHKDEENNFFQSSSSYAENASKCGSRTGSVIPQGSESTSQAYHASCYA